MRNLIIKKKAKRAVLSALCAELIYDDLRDILKERIKDIAIKIIQYEPEFPKIKREIDNELENIFIKAGGQTEIITKLNPKYKKELVNKLEEVMNYEW